MENWKRKETQRRDHGTSDDRTNGLSEDGRKGWRCSVVSRGCRSRTKDEDENENDYEDYCDGAAWERWPSVLRTCNRIGRDVGDPA